MGSIFDVRSSCPIPLRIDFFPSASRPQCLSLNISHTHFIVAALDHLTHADGSCQANVLFSPFPCLCVHIFTRSLPFSLARSISCLLMLRTNGKCAKHKQQIHTFTFTLEIIYEACIF